MYLLNLKRSIFLRNLFDRRKVVCYSCVKILRHLIKRTGEIKMKLSKKQIIGVSIVGMVLLTFGGTVSYQAYSNSESIKTEIKAEEHRLDTFEEAIDKLYLSDKKDFLAKDLEQEKIDTLKTNVDKAEKSIKDEKFDKKNTDLKKRVESLQSELEIISGKFELQTKINNLFEQAVLNGDTLTENVAIKEKISQADINEVNLENVLTSDEWMKKIESLKNEGTAQVTVIENANKLYEALNKDNTRKNLDAAIAATNKIKNSKSKKALQEKIAPITQKIEKKEAEEKAAQATVAKQSDSWDTNGNGVIDQDDEPLIIDPGTSSNTGNNVGNTGSNNVNPSTPVQPEQPQQPNPTVPTTPTTPSTGNGGQTTQDPWDTNGDGVINDDDEPLVIVP